MGHMVSEEAGQVSRQQITNLKQIKEFGLCSEGKGE